MSKDRKIEERWGAKAEVTAGVRFGRLNELAVS